MCTRSSATAHGSCVCTAEGRIQPCYQYQRDEVSSAGKATRLESTQESVPPQKETPQQKVQHSRFSHFSGASARGRKFKGKVLCFCGSHSERFVSSTVPYLWIHLYVCMGVFFLSGRGCITDVAKVSTLELLTTALSDPVHLQTPVIAGNIKTCAL